MVRAVIYCRDVDSENGNMLEEYADSNNQMMAGLHLPNSSIIDHELLTFST